MGKKLTHNTADKMLTPRQEQFLDFYYTPGSSSFGNAYESAIRSGYSDSYARNLTIPAIGNQWIRYNKRTSLTENHITSLIERIAIKGNLEKDQLKALEILAKMHGMLIDRSENKNLNIEMVLQDLK